MSEQANADEHAQAVEAARRLLEGIIDRDGSDTMTVARALLSLSAREDDARQEWQTISTAPDTPGTEEHPWGDSLPADLYGPRIGVQAGSLHRWPGQPATARIAHLHGDAVADWGVTHWRPRPS